MADCYYHGQSSPGECPGCKREGDPFNYREPVALPVEPVTPPVAAPSPVGGSAAEPRCKWPMCESEKVQQDIADQAYRALYSGEPAPSPVGGSADLSVKLTELLIAETRMSSEDISEIVPKIIEATSPIVEGGSADLTDWIGDVIREVAELPDRDSPPEWPAAMLVTGDELREIIERRALASRPAALAAPKNTQQQEGHMPPFAAPASQHDADERDELYDKAAMVVVSMRRASISLIQRTLMIGYNRAARLLEAMEREGVVSPMDNMGQRAVIATPATQQETDK